MNNAGVLGATKNAIKKQTGAESVSNETALLTLRAMKIRPGKLQNDLFNLINANLQSNNAVSGLNRDSINMTAKREILATGRNFSKVAMNILGKNTSIGNNIMNLMGNLALNIEIETAQNTITSDTNLNYNEMFRSKLQEQYDEIISFLNNFIEYDGGYYDIPENETTVNLLKGLARQFLNDILSELDNGNITITNDQYNIINKSFEKKMFLEAYNNENGEWISDSSFKVSDSNAYFLSENDNIVEKWQEMILNILQ